jgi:aryl-alcohol dehydrogenase-like predicted oxidoreductase
MATEFNSHRDELFISTKAGWDMWLGLMELLTARANT